MTTFKQSENYDYSEYLIPHGSLNGVAIPGFVTPEFRAEFQKDFKLRPESDIFIVTYPKSGTTWMQNILRKMLLTEDTQEWAEMPLTERFPWVDYIPSLSVTDLEKVPNPRVFKCHNHSPQEMDDQIFKGNRKAKIVYVVRDPRDACVSLYHHLQKAGVSDWMKKANFTDFFKTYFRDGKTVFYGLWEDHVNNWLSSRDEYDILVVKYEDLIEDSCKEISRVADFIGCDLTPEAVRGIAEKTSFANIKDQNLFKEDGHDGVHDSFLRKGVVGDWKNHFVDMADEEMMRKIADDLYKKHQI